MLRRKEIPFRPNSRIPFMEQHGAAAVLGISVIPFAIVSMVVHGQGWPGWIPWLVPLALLYRETTVNARAFNELARHWNKKIDEEEVAAATAKKGKRSKNGA